MKLTRRSETKRRPGGALGFTLEEVCISLGLSGITMASVIGGYLLAMRQSEWAASSAAAQSLAIQRVEQTRAAKWDRLASPPIDEVVASNFSDQVQPLGLPVWGTNVATATVQTTIRTLSSEPPLKLVQVDCVWSYLNRGLFTNTVFSYRSPDQ